MAPVIVLICFRHWPRSVEILRINRRLRLPDTPLVRAAFGLDNKRAVHDVVPGLSCRLRDIMNASASAKVEFASGSGCADGVRCIEMLPQRPLRGAPLKWLAGAPALGKGALWQWYEEGRTTAGEDIL